MVEARVQRRLSAILATDVVGYSRLMGQDEAGTLAALKALRTGLVDPKIAEHGGRIFKTTGDGVLAEFPSVVNAVACAVDIQRDADARNAHMPEERAIRFRIGINLGDVIVDGDDIFGDGVNVAARLEGIAPADGVVVSGTVRDHLGNRLDLRFEDMGEKAFKNIERPVRVYSVSRGASLSQPSVAAMVLNSSTAEKSSIAVLPFDNMSGDPEQEYFSDGITEDIITDLSKISGLMVIARNSSFAYKRKSPDIRLVGRELGVKSVLEGSIRRAGNRVRITAQLIDAATGAHLWAERYDRDLTDIFALQDEVTHQIVAALRVTLQPAERALLAESRPSNVEAHDCFLLGREMLLGSSKNRELFDRIVATFRRAIELDPAYAEPYAGLGMAYCLDFQNHWADTPDALDLAGHFVGRAIEKGPNEPYALYAASVIAVWKRDLEEAKAMAEKALAFNPNYALAYGNRGLIEVYLGHPLAAIPYLERAMRLDPAFTQQYLHFLGSAYLVAGQYEAAVAALRERIRLTPKTDLSRAFLASALGHINEMAEARRVWHELKNINTKYSFEEHLARLPFQNQADGAKIREGLAKAGLME